MVFGGGTPHGENGDASSEWGVTTDYKKKPRTSGCIAEADA
jgi:hypothetical protein